MRRGANLTVFLSWSGDRSKSLANALRQFLSGAFPSVQVWMSEHDIEAGVRWIETLDSKLKKSYFAVLCLTPENLDAPWLLFEAGSVTKGASRSRVVPYRLGLKSEAVPLPLAQFQGVDADERGTLGLLQSLNSVLGNSIGEDQLAGTFSHLWPPLKTQVEEILRSSSPAPASETAHERQRVRKLCERVAGAWWERVRGAGLGFFQIRMDDAHSAVQLVEGRFYDEDGNLVAFWNSVATRITERNGKVEIVYLRECRVPARNAKEWFHGYGDLAIEGNAEKPGEGSGMFFDVNRDDPQKTFGQPVMLRRLRDNAEIATIQMGSEADRKALVERVIAAW